MPLVIATREVDGIAVVDVSGNLWPRTENSSHVLSPFVTELLQQGNKKILLNLKGAEKHDNSGVGELVASLKAARNQRGELKLVNVSKTLCARLQFARLNTIFEIFEDETTAIRSFEEKPPIAIQSSKKELPIADKSSSEKRPMSIRFSVRRVDTITVVDVSGNLWPRTDRSGNLLRQFVQELLNNGDKQILLNLKGIREHDSSGVAELVASLKASREKGAKLKLSNLSETLDARVTYAHLHKIFDIYEDEASAIKSFGAAS
jgi:anti-sigma B factor antagonist